MKEKKPLTQDEAASVITRGLRECFRKRVSRVFLDHLKGLPYPVRAGYVNLMRVKQDQS